jgi:flavin-dependent dehydrogenase
MKFDVAVLGAGPGGSTLAALLARRGVSVALIERDTFPRDKLCGEFLSYDALPLLDLLGIGDEIARRGAPAIRRCRIVSRRRTFEFELPRSALGVSRLLFDQLLFRTAVAGGAQPFDGWTAQSIDHNTVTIGRAGECHTINAVVVAGAWGRWGRFDTQLARPFARDRSHRSFGFKRHYRALSPGAEGAIELYSFDRGYLGVNEVEDGLTNICGLVHAARLAGHRGRWESFVTAVRSEEPPLDAMYSRYTPAQDDFLSSEPVIFRGRRAVERGVFMIGDASGIVDPLTGNGMAMAMQSALLASPLILRALRRGSRTEIEAEYIAAHASMFHPRIRWSRAIATLLSRPAMLDAALRLAPTAGGRMFVRHTRAELAAVQRMADAWRGSSIV